MSFKPKQKTALLCKIMVVKCLLYLADVAVEFRVEVLRCQPNVRLTSYLRLAGQLSNRILSGFEAGVFL